MLEAPSVMPSSASSSSESSSSESIIASPQPVPDLLISAGLEDLAEMTEVGVAQDTVNPVEMVPRANTSAGLFLYIFWCHVTNFVEFDIGCTGAYDGSDVDAGLRQMVQRQSSAGVVDGDEGQIIDCLEHIRQCIFFTFVVFDLVSDCADSCFNEGLFE
jgi:hypothetical protein